MSHMNVGDSEETFLLNTLPTPDVLPVLSQYMH